MPCSSSHSNILIVNHCKERTLNVSFYIPGSPMCFILNVKFILVSFFYLFLFCFSVKKGTSVVFQGQPQGLFIRWFLSIARALMAANLGHQTVWELLLMYSNVLNRSIYLFCDYCYREPPANKSKLRYLVFIVFPLVKPLAK